MWGKEMTAGVVDYKDNYNEITYIPQLSLTFEYIDKLIGFEIAQFDGNDNKLETRVYTSENFNEIHYAFISEDYPEYALLRRNTKDVMIKKTFESRNNPNAAPIQYPERILLNSSVTIQKIEIPIPLNGLVTMRGISFYFHNSMRET